MPVRAVLFDIGDTLCHFPALPPTEAIRNETVRRILALLRSWGIEPTDQHRFLGRDIRLTIERANQQAYEGDCISPHFPTLAGRVASTHGLDLSAEQAEELWETWNLGSEFLGRRVFEDAFEMLDELRDRGYRLAAVTNRSLGGATFLNEIDALGLGGYFEHWAISCDLGYMKPHPEIFRHALEALDVAPQETVMVGDSLRADVAGAQALGMVAVWRRRPNTREQIDGIRPDFVVDELREIPRLACFG
jgi:HAD superfamily hydrolase (TIGR01509 family)